MHNPDPFLIASAGDVGSFDVLVKRRTARAAGGGVTAARAAGVRGMCRVAEIRCRPPIFTQSAPIEPTASPNTDIPSAGILGGLRGCCSTSWYRWHVPSARPRLTKSGAEMKTYCVCSHSPIPDDKAKFALTFPLIFVPNIVLSPDNFHLAHFLPHTSKSETASSFN